MRFSHLDWQVCDSELEAHRGHLRIDDYYVRVLTLKELPSETRTLLLNGLLDIPANFHVVTEWHPVDNAKARKEIASRRRHYHNSKTASSPISRTARTLDRRMNWSMIRRRRPSRSRARP